METYFDQATVWDFCTPAQSCYLRQLDDKQYRATLACIASEVLDYGLNVEDAISMVMGDCEN
jgi:hypothetical protein